jgi:hypothetical protein
VLYVELVEEESAGKMLMKNDSTTHVHSPRHCVPQPSIMMLACVTCRTSWLTLQIVLKS